MSRFFTNLVIGLLSGFVVMSSQVFAAPTVAWIAFGAAVAVLAISALVQLDGQRGIAQRILDLAMIGIAAVLIVFSLVFVGATVTWLAFGLSLGWLGLAVTGLTLHEVEMWRSANGLAELRWFVVTGRETHHGPSLTEAA